MPGLFGDGYKTPTEEQQRLDRARARFSGSPPSSRSHQSHNLTLPQSPNPSSEEQRRREEQKWRVKWERGQSFPDNQFDAQESEEFQRILEADRNWTNRLPVGTNFQDLAHENVKKRWVEQGIWNDKWNGTVFGLWKHQEPLELEPESETDS